MNQPDNVNDMTIYDLLRIVESDDNAEVHTDDAGQTRVTFTATISGPPGGLIVGALADDEAER